MEKLLSKQENKSIRDVTIKNNSVTSSDIFGDSKELKIIHNQEEYKLRLTGNSKLILTK